MEYDLKVLKINKNKIEQLNELSIYTVKDLVQHYPYRFEEMLETPLHDESKVIIEAQLIDEPKIFYKGRFSRLTFPVCFSSSPAVLAESASPSGDLILEIQVSSTFGSGMTESSVDGALACRLSVRVLFLSTTGAVSFSAGAAGRDDEAGGGGGVTAEGAAAGIGVD